MPDSPADQLTAAAKLLRERATAATPGPWVPSIVRSPRSTVTSGIYSHAHPAGSAASEIAASGRKGRECGGVTNPDNATYIALMHPGVGLALADWLDREAAIWNDLETTKAELHPKGFKLTWGMSTHAEALAMARQILGEVTE
jgi:hypothetical protein